MLDDEFKLHNPENERFKGVPRPELDDAWKDLVQGGLYPCGCQCD